MVFCNKEVIVSGDIIYFNLNFSGARIQNTEVRILNKDDKTRIQNPGDRIQNKDDNILLFWILTSEFWQLSKAGNH